MTESKAMPYDPGLYDDAFFHQWGALNRDYVRSARAVAEEIFRLYEPESVLDAGCGAGFHAQRLTELGARVVCADFIACPPRYRASGIPEIESADFSVKLEPDRFERVDLVLCLDVAEHLPNEASYTLADNLTAFSDLVLFSAAPPWQDGIGHINEQPHGYWKRRFAKSGFRYCRSEAGLLDQRCLLRRDEITLRWMATQLRVYRRGLKFPYPRMQTPPIEGGE